MGHEHLQMTKSALKLNSCLLAEQIVASACLLASMEDVSSMVAYPRLGMSSAMMCQLEFHNQCGTDYYVT